MKNKAENLRITISDYRAIESADISLNGITVLSGTNGTGKSTISRLVYEIIEGAINYDSIVIEEVNHHLSKYYNVLQNIIHLLDLSSNTRAVFRDKLRSISIESPDDFDSFERTVSLLCDQVLALYENEGNQVAHGANRVQTIIKFTLDLNQDVPIQEALKQMKSNIHQRIEKAQDKIRTRPSGVFNESMKDLFGESVKDRVSVYEYGECLFGMSSLNVPLPHFIQNSFYINTPFILGAESFSNHVIKLNEALRHPKGESFTNTIVDVISNDVIGGKARFDEEGVTPGFRFLSNSEEEFNLEECATGIKSFSILQMLICNGYINNNTLLILDEPEAHLHPQWVVEYARLIVLLHKNMGVRFLISTHSTDMVLALKYISEALQDTQALEFYCAGQRSTRGKYIFKSVGLDIEPIFNSFNRSFDKLEFYANKGNTK